MSEPSERYAEPLGQIGGRLTWSETKPVEGCRTWVLTLESADGTEKPVDGLLVDDDVWGFELDGV